MSEQIVPQDFYVYVHRRASDGRVFYVGKGHGNRAWSTARNKHWHRVAKKHGLKVEIFQDGLQEWYAFELEMGLIALYGRENLCNMTDGGEGTSGFKHCEETRLAQSTALKGKPRSEETRLALGAKPIRCIETGQIFQTSLCAEKWLRQTKPKAAGTAVYKCCKNRAKSAYGYTWRYVDSQQFSSTTLER
jgi:hypothetical protein